MSGRKKWRAMPVQLELPLTQRPMPRVFPDFSLVGRPVMPPSLEVVWARLRESYAESMMRAIDRQFPALLGVAVRHVVHDEIAIDGSITRRWIGLGGGVVRTAGVEPA